MLRSRQTRPWNESTIEENTGAQAESFTVSRESDLDTVLRQVSIFVDFFSDSLSRIIVDRR
jgi:hypothetical protein